MSTIAPGDGARARRAAARGRPRVRRRARHRLRAEGQDRHADDHGRRRGGRHRARAAAVRGHGREDRRLRRAGPGPGGEGHLAGDHGGQLRDARPGAACSPARPASTSTRCWRRWTAAPADSTMRALKAEPMLEHDFTPLFKLAHMLKDVRLCLAEARTAGGAFPSPGAPPSSTARASGAAWASRTSRRCSRWSKGLTGARLVTAGAFAPIAGKRSLAKNPNLQRGFEISRACA